MVDAGSFGDAGQAFYGASLDGGLSDIFLVLRPGLWSHLSGCPLLHDPAPPCDLDGPARGASACGTLLSYFNLKYFFTLQLSVSSNVCKVKINSYLPPFAPRTFCPRPFCSCVCRVASGPLHRRPLLVASPVLQRFCVVCFVFEAKRPRVTLIPRAVAVPPSPVSVVPPEASAVRLWRRLRFVLGWISVYLSCVGSTCFLHVYFDVFLGKFADSTLSNFNFSHSL